jgi:hypothetical protein
MSAAENPLDVARRALEPGERLVWADRPHPQALARSRMPQRIRGVLGLAVIGVLFWFSFVPNWPGGANGLFLGLVLVAAIVYALWLLAQPEVARRAAAQTVYAMSDRRLMILEDWPRPRLRSFAPGELDAPQLGAATSTGESGLGSVVFIHRKLPWWQRSAGRNYRFEAFYGIAEAERVAERIEALRRGTDDPPEEDA